MCVCVSVCVCVTENKGQDVGGGYYCSRLMKELGERVVRGILVPLEQGKPFLLAGAAGEEAWRTTIFFFLRELNALTMEGLRTLTLTLGYLLISSVMSCACQLSQECIYNVKRGTVCLCQWCMHPSAP